MVSVAMYVWDKKAVETVDAWARKKNSTWKSGSCGDEDKLQVIGEVFEEDMHRTSIFIQLYNCNLFGTEWSFVPYVKIHTLDHVIRAINHTHFTAFLEKFHIVSNETIVGEMTVTIHRDHSLS